MSVQRQFDSMVTNRWLLPVAMTVLHVMLALMAFHQAPATGGDDATYISLARSLIERRDYTNIGDAAMQPHTVYPPVFAVIVAGGLIAGLDPAVGLKLLMVLISGIAVLASCIWLRRVASPGVAVCAGFFIAISPELVRLAPGVLSDTAFWWFSMLALLAWNRADVAARESVTGRMPLQFVVAAAAATLLAYFTRSAGAPLVAGAFVWLLLRRQPRAAGVLAGLAVPLIFAWWFRGRAAGAESYVASFLFINPYDPSLGSVTPVDLLERVRLNASVYVSRQLSRLALGTPTIGAAFGVPLAAAVLWGWGKRARKPSLPEIWFGLYLVLVLAWPVTWSGPRFLVPIVPLIALYAFEATAPLLRRGTYPRVYATAAVLAGVGAIAPALRNQIEYAGKCRAEYADGQQFPCVDSVYGDFFRTAEATRGRLPEGAIVLSRKPSLFYHHSGYRSRVYPMYAEADSLFALAGRLGAQYLVVDKMSQLAGKYLVPIIAANQEKFCVMPEFSTPNATFVRLVTPWTGRGSDRGPCPSDEPAVPRFSAHP